MPRDPIPLRRRAARRSPCAGFSLLEVMLALLVLAVALLSQVTTTMGEHRLSRDERYRVQALHAGDQMLQRLRADEDWPSLYPRLRALADLSATAGSLDAGQVRFEDGRRAFVPQAYYPDFAPPPLIESLHVLVEVPSAAPDLDPLGARVLREDVAMAGFGLPADLNLDGAVDAAPRDADYLILPVRIRLRWLVPGEAAREIAVPAWIRGER